MYIDSLELSNFKNLNGRYDLNPGINLIIAPNGTGKTNFLEAIHVLALGNSFNNFAESNLLKVGLDVNIAKLLGTYSDEHLEVILSRNEDKISKVLKKNGLNKRISQYNSLIPIILFAPRNVDIVSGAPDIRRGDLDNFLSSISPEYKVKLNEYKIVVRNRNKVLSRLASRKGTLEELDFWTNKMIVDGSIILYKRKEVIDQIRDDLNTISAELIRNSPQIRIEYKSKIDLENIEKSFRNKIDENLDKEVAAERSLYGPHRDDIEFYLNEIPLRESGSRGQQRLAVLVYKLALMKFYKNNFGKYPILLLDDIMSELDDDHRASVERYIQNINSQIVITGCSSDDFSEGFINSSNSINL